jgi:hypothetical protein
VWLGGCSSHSRHLDRVRQGGNEAVAAEPERLGLTTVTV